MAFLRGKQAGMQHDLSAGIPSAQFSPDEQSRYGINSQISCLAYDPVQSLLAVGTSKSKFGSGQIYVFGSGRVHKFFVPRHEASFRQLRLVANRLISLDSTDELLNWNLDDPTENPKNHTNAGGVACMLTDPSLDWALLGMASGDITAYDIDRGRPALDGLRIPNFWHQREPRARSGAVLVAMQLHPRDIGQLLIAYSHGAVIYSFKSNEPTKFFQYEVPPGAPGGSGGGGGPQDNINALRRPRLTHALWHPTGAFIVTAHDDGSLVFWDPRDGRVVMARTLYATKVNEPAADSHAFDPPSLKEPFVQLAWCCKENPDDTALLVAGGQRVDEPDKGLTLIELGLTPLYEASSWDMLATYCVGKRTTTLRTPPGAEVVQFCLVPRESPHYAGAQDPIAVLCLLSSGELIAMSFPSGYPISPTNQLHPSLSFVAPFVSRFAVATLDRGRWLGMQEKRQQGEPLLKGGSEGHKPSRRYQGRNIIQVAHADSTVRIWDVGHADEMENPAQLQVDVARALARYDDVAITTMDMAETTGEFAAGTSAGEVVIYRWGTNKAFGRDDPASPPRPLDPNPGGISDISSRAEPSLKDGLQPFALYEMMQGPITVVTVSDVGFVAVGSELGFLSILDLRGPSVIYQVAMAELAKPDKKGFLRGHGNSGGSTATPEWPVVIEFGVMTLEGDSYSSIACFVGTNHGRLATFKLLPAGQGYTVKLAGVVNLGDRIVAICPIIADTGAPAAATGPIVAGLRNGQQVNGTLVVATQTEARIFKPATSKGASKSFDNALCDAAAVAEFELYGYALVGLFGDRTARAYTLPGLKEIGRKTLPMLDPSRTTAAAVARTGDILAWTGPSEMTVIPVWGTGVGIKNTNDTLINPMLKPPMRPTISTLQWAIGVQYLSPTDLDLLIGGPNRPPSEQSKKAAAEHDRARMAQNASATDASASATDANASGSGSGSGSDNPETLSSYIRQQFNKRTEGLNLMGDSMEGLQETSSGWAEDVSKFISKQKRDMLLGGITKGMF